MKRHTRTLGLGLLLWAVLLGGYGCTLSVEDVDLDTSPYLEGLSSSQGLSNLSATSSTGLSSGGVSSNGDEARDLILVDCGAGGTCTPGDTTVPLGTSLLFTFTANANYAIDSISLNGVVRFASDTTSALYDSFEVSLKNIQGEYDIVVRFKPRSSTSSGTLSSTDGSSSSISGSSSSDAGSSSSTVSSSSGGIKITVDCGAGGSCSPGTMDNVVPGTTQKFTFTADAGNIIDTIALDGVVRFNSDSASANYGTYSFTLGNIQISHIFVARFKSLSTSSSSVGASSSSSLSSSISSSSSSLSSSVSSSSAASSSSVSSSSASSSSVSSSSASSSSVSSSSSASSSSVSSSSSASSSSVSSSSIPEPAVGQFDLTQSPSTGEGTLSVDFSPNQTSKVEIRHSNGNWYTPAGWPIEDCPNGEGACWWGWNLADAVTDTGFSIRVSLIDYMNKESWGYSNAGSIFIFKGTQISTAEYVNIGNSIAVKVLGANGKKVKLYLYDEPHIGGVVPKYTFVANGGWQTFTIQASDFRPAEGIDMTRVKALALQYELTAANAGDPISAADGYPITEAPLIWQSLKTAE